MKHKFSYILMIATVFIISACEKNDFNYPEGTVGSSYITKYANFTMKGDRYTVLKPGETYVEAGVTAESEGNQLAVTIGGEKVNTSASGVYTIKYFATNKDGFTTYVPRTVVIADIKPSAKLNDFSGKYKRTSNQETATWTKVADGVYTVVNPGGAANTTLTVVAVNEEENKIKIPQQLASDGTPTSSINETYNATSKPITYTWTIINPGYGEAPRTFEKQ